MIEILLQNSRSDNARKFTKKSKQPSIHFVTRLTIVGVTGLLEQVQPLFGTRGIHPIQVISPSKGQKRQTHIPRGNLDSRFH